MFYPHNYDERVSKGIDLMLEMWDCLEYLRKNVLPKDPNIAVAVRDLLVQIDNSLSNYVEENDVKDLPDDVA